MNASLLERLCAFTGAPASRECWGRVIMVRNLAPVPPEPPTHNELSTTGFKLIVLSPSGTPSWFARCGWVGDGGLQIERRILTVLSAGDGQPYGVPHTESFEYGELLVIMTEYSGTQSFSQTLYKESPGSWIRCAGEILNISERQMRRLQGDAHNLGLIPPSRAVDATLSNDLSVLSHAGFSQDELSTIKYALKPLDDFRPVLQHGDLWSDNVLACDDGWRIIDFAECGHVWVPLYDAMHLSTCGAIGQLHPERWIATGQPHTDIWPLTKTQLLIEAARRIGINSSQRGACAIYYLMHLAAYRLRPGIPMEFSQQLIDDLRRVIHFLRNGGSTSTIIPD